MRVVWERLRDDEGDRFRLVQEAWQPDFLDMSLGGFHDDGTERGKRHGGERGTEGTCESIGTC